MNEMEQYRNDFPMLRQTMHGKPLLYLDTAATAHKPEAVIDAVSDFYRNGYGTVHRAVYQLAASSTFEYQNARRKVQKFLNAQDESEIVFTRGTTDGINLAASSFGKAFIRPGDEIIVTEMEHHAGIVPWQILCEDRGAVLKVVPFDANGELRLDIYKQLLGPKTKIVSLVHVSNTLGTENPVEEMVRAAHKFGAKVLVDGAQAAPHMPIDVQALDADFYVFSGHKLYGPTGIGILYGKKELLEVLPPTRGGGDMIETVTLEKTTYNRPPIKFEAGTPPIAQAVGLAAAIDYVQAIGMSRIADYEQMLLEYATERLHSVDNLKIIGQAPKKGAIISFTVDGIHPLDLATLLDMAGIAVRSGHACAQPTLRHFQLESVLRASFGLYNTKEEIDRFANSLKSCTQRLK